MRRGTASLEAVEPADRTIGQRAQLLLAYRLNAHGMVTAIVRRRPTRVRTTLATGLLLAIGDVAVATLVRWSHGPKLVLRTVLDTVEAVAVSAIGPASPVATRCAFLTAVPTSIDAGYQLGRRLDQPRFADLAAAVLPASVVTATSAATRRSRHLRLGLAQIGWPLLGVGGGLVVGLDRRALRKRTLAAWLDHTGPRIEAAWWRAQHDVAMDERDVRSPHNIKKDLLILERAGSTSARRARLRLTERKDEVAELTAPYGQYLGDVITAWDVQLQPASAWSVRLSPSQAAQLTTHLAAHPAPHGGRTTVVVVNEDEARHSGGRVDLVTAPPGSPPSLVVLDAVAPPEPWLTDPAPGGFLLAAVWKVVSVFITPGAPRTAALAALIDLAAAGAYKEATPSEGEMIRPVVAALVSTSVYLVLLLRTIGRQFIDGGDGKHAYFAANNGITGFTIVAARYVSHLSGRQRMFVAAATLGLLFVMLATGPWPTDLLSFLASDVSSALLPFAGVVRFGTFLDEDAEAVWRAYSSASHDAVVDAYAAGVRAECRLLSEVVDQARRAVAEVDIERISQQLLSMIRANLEGAQQWLVERSASS